MQYRPFGKTGFNISTLGFGSMRLPIIESDPQPNLDAAVELLRYGFSKGINYVDTAFGYCGGHSEYAVGRALKDGWREKVKLATKLPMWDLTGPDDFKRTLDKQLRKLDTDHIDFYHFHAMSYDTFKNKLLAFKLLEVGEKLRDQGVIKHLCFSYHDPKPETMLEVLNTEAFASVLCQFNLLDRANLENIQRASELGMGVVVMGPVGGGRLSFSGGVFEAALGNKMTTPEVAMRFVVSTPGVSCALSGMGDKQMVDENVKVCSNTEGLSKEELLAIEEVSLRCADLQKLYCTGCAYCVKGCPAEVNIPKCFEATILSEVFGLELAAQQIYDSIGASPWVTGKTAEACINCKKCLKSCPQNLPIPDKLKECVAKFGKK